MTVKQYISTILYGYVPGIPKRDAVDQQIREVKAEIRKSAQAIESGARVIENMSGAMRMLAESEKNEENR